MTIQQLLIDHIDIWTAADTAKKSGRGRSSGNAANVYGIKKLRELILELAVRGKLVPQDENDEPASELLKRIQVEKAKLIAEGKIKKSKPLEPITDEEMPFELPQTWKWVFLPDVSNYKVGKTPSTKSSIYWTTSGDGFNWVSIADLNHDGSVFETNKQITDKAASEVFRCDPAPAGTILMSFKLTLGKISILDGPAFHNEAIISIYPNQSIFKGFLFKVLPARAMDGNSKSAIKGNTLNSESIAALLIPLPPLTEQYRIVAKVDELMALCDQLESQHSNATEAHEKLVSYLLDTLTQSQSAEDFNTNWQRIAAHFDTLFTTETSIDALKQTLLQLAVMGKLVPQDPNDEPTSELLKRILRERDRQIEHEGSRTIANDEIQKSEMYISAPDCWLYCRLGNIARFIDYRGKTPSKISSGISLITAKNVRFGYISREPEEYVSATEYESWMTRGFPRVGDMLFTTEAPLGNIAIVDISEKFALAQRVICFKLHDQAIGAYLKIAIMSDHVQQQLINASTGMTATGIKASKLKEIPVPIPPLAEQHRIVAKIDELMVICDQLKSRFTEANQLQQKLADVLVEQSTK